MEDSRRRFLMLAGISAVGLTAKPVLDAFAVEQKQDPTIGLKKAKDALTAKQWGMVIDTRNFHSAEDLEPIIEACHKTHNVPSIENEHHEVKWIWEEHFHNAFPGLAQTYQDERTEHAPFLALCNHCENPPCCRVCPTKATFKRESDGIVLMDFHRCIGCRFCMAACPYGSRSFNFRDPRPFIEETNKSFPTRMKGVVEKCNFCAERLAVGKQPACAEASDGAIVFGDLHDPASEVRELLRTNYTIRRKQGLGTEPAVYYIV
jgi:molybdopterin-containing oxidoreductase family iron-sulfur binding subunit